MSTPEEKESHLRALHDATYNAQNSAIEEVRTPQPRYTAVLEHVRKTFRAGTHSTLSLVGETLYEGIANVRICGDHWERAEVIVCGQRIATLYKCLDRNSFPLLDNGVCLPFVAGNPIQIHVDDRSPPGSADYAIEYDRVVCEAEDVQFVYTDFQYTGCEELSSAPVNKMRLPFNHPCTNITVKFEKPVELVELHLQPDNMTTNYIIPLEKISEREFFLDFGSNTVNLSRIWHSYAIVKNSEPDNIAQCYVESLHILSKAENVYTRAFYG
jgi:hypothetical protein